MEKITLLIGTNVGDRQENLAEARKQLQEKLGELISSSAIYETAAWGKTDQDSFYNQVLIVNTNLSPEAALETILNIEQSMGRQRTVKWSPRLIDIDILFYGDRIINSAELIIPHPFIQERRFTLVPLAELNPTGLHPLSGKSMQQLLEEVNDPLSVHKVTAPALSKNDSGPGASAERSREND